jgi:rod shape-determining protein MreC
MLRVRRWWDRCWLQIILTGTVLGGAWVLRQTQSAFVTELYSFLVQSFQSQPEEQIQQQLRNARIAELEQRLAEVESQNQRLKKLLGYVKSQKQPVIAAPVIGRSADSWWQQIIVGVGKKDGIEKDFVVTGIGGLVGRVVEVSDHTSRVLLISDRSSRVGAGISRSRSLGFIQGNGSQLAVMQFFEKVSNVRPGDVVTTSSVSQLFPSGLPIGKVKSIDPNKSPAPEAIIELTAPLNYLEWVVVQPFENKL